MPPYNVCYIFRCLGGFREGLAASPMPETNTQWVQNMGGCCRVNLPSPHVAPYRPFSIICEIHPCDVCWIFRWLGESRQVLPCPGMPGTITHWVKNMGVCWGGKSPLSPKLPHTDLSQLFVKCLHKTYVTFLGAWGNLEKVGQPMQC